ncbi:unnamed protein product [Zymoseptoria tritici ST99CH_1E4]|uniref:non-specific serine/threonine protein kinase n=1 Tax=Zymoseptoria tritici ST99CH_1E4 TaxID=1276532 RepID=A0A2H1H4F9_ZYMTR|nr:unnamed protein product [Zymoseptoria tritici ST99CH_1E4]
MPTSLPSPPIVASTAASRASHRASTSVRHATPKQTTGSVGAGSAGLRSSKVRGSSDKENGPQGGKVSAGNGARRQSVVPRDGFGREKMPSKDGTAQRHAKEVEGLKDYQLGHCLGRGAFGSVYCALNWSTGETVAIKQVRLSDMPRTELNVIMQEIDLLKNLHHANIVKYHGFVKTPDSLYIILEYCEQGSLHQICKNFGKFPENLVALYIAQVLQGLLFLHEQGVIHRDIKGANILTTKEGLVKLADFGVATKQQGLSEGSVVGTPYWMAPEVIELSGATTASDIWSLGCTVIELLDGRPPYHQFAPMPALFRIVNDDHPPLPEGASPTVRDFLMQCFQKDPNLRVSAKKLLKHPWIASARKTADVRKPRTEYDEAVKSVQQWNEALKASPPPATTKSATRNHASAASSRPPPSKALANSRTGSKPSASGTIGKSAGRRTSLAPASKTPNASNQPPAKPAFRLGQRRPHAAESFQSPIDNERQDNWDSDFESLSSGVSGLQIPDRLRPQDNFAGLFSSEKLKQYANLDAVSEMDGKVEAWDEEFEGDLTVRSSMKITAGDALQTVRLFLPKDTTNEEIKHQSPGRLAARTRRSSADGQLRNTSSDFQPKTQILKPASIPNMRRPNVPEPRLSPAPISRINFCEDEEDEDYSDLIPNDEDAFIKKIADFSPSRRLNAGGVHNVQALIAGGSLRRTRTRTPTHVVHDAAAMKRTRSSMEIQKYAEDEHDEDFTELLFDEEPVLSQAVSRSPKSAVSMGSEFAGSERGTLKLNNSSSWGGEDEDEDDDPFAALEEELDEVDLESNVARDKHARLCAVVEGLVCELKLGQPEDVLTDIVQQLLQILAESPDVKSVIVSSHGMLPILEILETANRPHIIFRLLRIVNLILERNIEVQENLCFVGGIPIITKFAHKKYSSDIRLEAAAFVRAMYQGGVSLQMFVSCGGLNVLVEFLEEDYDSDAGRELVLVGVNGIWSVFEMQGPTPKNDFCRILSRSSVLYPLSLVLNRVLDERNENLEDEDAATVSEVIEGRIVNIFLLFSQAENHVKELVAERMVLKRVLKDLRRMSPQHQITMLKFIKNLSMLATTLDALQNSNAIEVLTDLLNSILSSPASSQGAYFRDISNQVLNTMFNLCRLSKPRQEDAALSGVIPLLQRIVQTERPLKEFALPILCDMAHSGKVGRKILWQNKGLQFYVSLLAEPYWAVTALDAIFVWALEETAKVEEFLILDDEDVRANAGRGKSTSTSFASAMVSCFNTAKADAFENLLEPLQKLLRLSPAVAGSLAHRSLFERSGVKLHSKKALVRLNLLRVIRSICDASENVSGMAGQVEGSLLERYGLLEAVRALAVHDPAILVREMAGDLVRSSDYAMQAAGAELGNSSIGHHSRNGSSAHANMGMRRTSSSGSGLGASLSPLLSQSSFSTNSTPARERGHSGAGSGSIRTGINGIGYFDLLPNNSAGGLVSGMTPSAAANARNTPYLHAQRSPSRPASRDSSVGWNTGNSALRGSTRHAPSMSAPSSSNMGAPPMRRPVSRLGLAAGRSEKAGNVGDAGTASTADHTPTHVPPPHNPTGGGRVLQKVKRRGLGGTDGVAR